MSDQLLQEYRDTSELREAVRVVGEPGAELGGLWGGALAFFLAAWDGARGEGSRGACLIITATQEEADELVEDLEVFLPGRAALFPVWESLFVEDSTPDPEICQGRLSVFDGLVGGRRRESFVVAPIQAVVQPVPSIEELRQTRLELRLGEERSPRELVGELVRRGYRHASLVEEAGEFSLRGDVLDFFPHCRSLPLRLEFFGETLDSLREFDPGTQRSVSGTQPRAVDLLLPATGQIFKDCYRGQDVLLTDLLPPASVIFLKEPEATLARARKVLQNILGDRAEAVAGRFIDKLEKRAPTSVRQLPVASDASGGRNLNFPSVERFRSTELDKVFESLGACLGAGGRLRIYCENQAERARFNDLLADHRLNGAAPGLEVLVGRLRAGFEVGQLRLAVLTSRELFNRHVVRRLRRAAVPTGRAIESFLELQRGDYVVHVTHGIGRFLGIENLRKDGTEQEFLVLKYRDEVKVYVPVARIELVQKYVGAGDRPPVLDKVGGVAWERRKETVETALLDLASELLETQALRKERPGISYPEDSEWQRQFEASFPFHDTPDQVEITKVIKNDMEAPRPTDRLICGDVGYGKTELALRAAFKTVDGGRQVAALVPTTVLAEQHYRTFRERMAEFPVTVEVLSRFRTPARQKEILERLAAGSIDIVVGTHRMLSDDVAFADLGLLIIDEEQRFGVLHKEKFKKIRREVDVISLSATPIPRTLHMALLGIRDVSNLTTPPEGRTPIHTELSRFDRRKIREIIIRELNRDGQILFVHNRVRDIEVIRRELESIVPEATIDVAHGQMRERLLEEKMLRFIERETDLLIATTIVENGIDIPTANTIIINEADRYGLADLHQLRGRVGRSKHQAYCYLLLPDHRHVSPEARKRLQALVEFSGLGAGFQIAMRDLEIRGAGNLLGKEQSGHIAVVGYDMFCRLLEKCVRKLKNEKYIEPVPVEVDLALEAYVPDGYLAGEAAKIELYRRISRLEEEEACVDVEAELKDRYGSVPREVRRLLEIQRLRILCRQRGVSYVGREEDNIVLRGDESMKALLDSCRRKIAVIDRDTVAIRLRKGGVGPSPPVFDDESIFEWTFHWMETGEFPRIGTRPGRIARLEASSARSRRRGCEASSSRRGSS